MKRRTFLQTALAGALGLQLGARAANTRTTVEVYKSANCGCCGEWITHLRKNGYTVTAHDVANPSDYREQFGMPQALGSCHTAKVDGYVLEGHVPASEVKRLLAERPKAIGLAVPSMPLGAPGMEGARIDAYDVFLVQANGRRSVYRHYAGT